MAADQGTTETRPAWVRPSVEALPRHGTGAPGAADFAGPNAPKVHMLHLNESPYPPSPKAIEAFRAEQIAQVDAISKRVAQAVTDAASVLTVEQRRKIEERMRPRPGFWGGWHR